MSHSFWCLLTRLAASWHARPKNTTTFFHNRKLLTEALSDGVLRNVVRPNITRLRAADGWYRLDDLWSAMLEHAPHPLWQRQVSHIVATSRWCVMSFCYQLSLTWTDNVLHNVVRPNITRLCAADGWYRLDDLWSAMLEHAPHPLWQRQVSHIVTTSRWCVMSFCYQLSHTWTDKCCSEQQQLGLVACDSVARPSGQSAVISTIEMSTKRGRTPWWLCGDIPGPGVLWPQEQGLAESLLRWRRTTKWWKKGLVTHMDHNPYSILYDFVSLCDICRCVTIIWM